ncbi:MAG: hypothetical protein SXV54_01740 [Chloroflexota bacterium]|nr:hypothetical protein [Chloroflexota bacterium]
MTVDLIDVCPNVGQRFTGLELCHHVPRDVYADPSAKGVVVKDLLPIGAFYWM